MPGWQSSFTVFTTKGGRRRKRWRCSSREISTLCDRVGVPRRLSQLGVTAEQIPDIVRSSRGSSMSGNPRELSDAELTAILEEIL